MCADLREGFTTGSAATGAALAAAQLLYLGSSPASVRVPLPPFVSDATSFPNFRTPRDWLELPVFRCMPGVAPELAEAWTRQDGTADPAPASMKRAAHAVVIKDGGDDPDVTTGAHITATIVEEAFEPFADENMTEGKASSAIAIWGGPGVGRVTLPGLPVPMGEPAINPVPREQLGFALTALRQSTPSNNFRARLNVYISVPGGDDLAKKTFNPRLGIVGGISILGTQGTVKPYSHAAWKATIRQGLLVAKASGCHYACLSTGRRSERLLMSRYPALSAQCFVQMADFAAFSLKLAGEMGFSHLVWSGFFGKLLKLAQGHAYTHAHDATLNMDALAEVARCEQAACAESLSRCVTASSALELLLRDPAGPRILHRTVRTAAHVAQQFAGQPVHIHLFHLDGKEVLAL